MTEFAKGLRLNVVDRDEYDEFIKENAHDPTVNMEAWGDNSVPESIFIVRMMGNDEQRPYYHCLNKHVNGVVTTEYIDAEFLNSAIEFDVIKNTENYDVTFVENNLD
jgi:hypothetical protein